MDMAFYMRDPRPVSYTHLDVYKRQLQGLAGLVASAKTVWDSREPEN